jgi:uncharacterized RmlC-like cupin family protein
MRPGRFNVVAITITAALFDATGATSSNLSAGETNTATGKVVRGSPEHHSKQGALYAPGISAETVGAKSLFLGMVSLPPGGRTKAHVHQHHESGFYFLSGEEVELWTGRALEHREVARPGDYLFIPPNVPHVAVNRSTTTAAVFIGARNEATAQESVVMHPELDAKPSR